jgi:hypothetical protein
VFTSNRDVVYIVDKHVHETETKAFAERFGVNKLFFPQRLPNPDRRFKVWGRCQDGLALSSSVGTRVQVELCP